MASRLTVVTGAPGIDIGRAVAQLGTGIDDGMAVRVIDSNRVAVPHTSPDPFHGHHHSAVGGCTGNGTIDPCRIGSVRLRYLPSAWQDPQTNLGVCFTGHAHSALNDDVHTLDALGLNPAHRLTVQARGGPLRRDYTFPLPIEPGNLGVQARDAVLRAGGRVIVEAGDGMTFLTALAALDLPPWAPWIGHLDLWVVIDASDALQALAPGETLDLRFDSRAPR